MPAKGVEKDAAPSTEQARASGVVVEWAVADESQSVVSLIKIRNGGRETVDVSRFRVSSSGTHHLRLLSGTFELPPGAVAHIIASSDVDPNDEPRQRYDNLYSAVDAGDSVISLDADAFRLIDAAGRVVFIPDDPGVFTLNVDCCADSTSCCVSGTPKPDCCNNPYPACSYYPSYWRIHDPMQPCRRQGCIGGGWTICPSQ